MNGRERGTRRRKERDDTLKQRKQKIEDMKGKENSKTIRKPKI